MRRRVQACGVLLAVVCAAAEPAEEVSIGGDVRIRHESKIRTSAFGDDLDHGRIRVRVGLDAKVDENWDVGVRLATGGGTTSTNQDLDALNDPAELYVDRAFARYRTGEANRFEFVAGRMPNPYFFSPIMWDSDFNPDGLSERLVFRRGSVDLFLTAGQHVLGQLSDRSYGPGLFAAQYGTIVRRPWGSFTMASAYYAFTKGDTITDPKKGDVPPGEDYAVADLYVELAAETAAGLPFSSWIDGLVNLEASRHSSAYGVGLSVGSAKGRGKLRAKAAYMSIERDALWINLGDASFSGGLTAEDMHGFVLGLAVGLGEGASLGATWYYKDSRDTDAHEDQIKIDLVVKF